MSTGLIRNIFVEEMYYHGEVRRSKRISDIFQYCKFILADVLSEDNQVALLLLLLLLLLSLS
jgi:hypothetical protein